MSHTIVEIFVKVTPVHLYRRSGSKNSPQLTKLRTMPPRELGESFEVKVYNKDGVQYVNKDSGGISTFDMAQHSPGKVWWRIPKGTRIPLGLRVSRDASPNPGTKRTHYTIRPLVDMPLTRYISLLEELAKSAELSAEDINVKSGNA